MARVEAIVDASVVVAFASRSAPSSSVSVLSVSKEESNVEVTPADAAVDSYRCTLALQQQVTEPRRLYGTYLRDKLIQGCDDDCG